MAAGTSMLGSRSVASAQRSVVDTDRVLKSMDRTLHRNLSRLGAFGRTRARSSLRYRVKPAPPGVE